MHIMVTLLLVNLIRSVYGKFQPKYNDTEIDKGRLSTFKALKYSRINHGDQRFFQFEIIINVFHFNTLYYFSPVSTLDVRI